MSHYVNLLKFLGLLQTKGYDITAEIKCPKCGHDKGILIPSRHIMCCSCAHDVVKLSEFIFNQPGIKKALDLMPRLSEKEQKEIHELFEEGKNLN